MSSKTLELGKFSLALNSEKLKLEIDSSVQIKFSSGWDPSAGENIIVKALESGSIWISRGRRCRVDVQIFFDGKPLERSSRISLLESLGYHLRDAHVSSSVSLCRPLLIP